MQPVAFEREAIRRLPSILADLLDVPPDRHFWRDADESGPDIVAEAGGRTWFIEVKSSSSPGTVAAVARHLGALDYPEGLSLLVVPYMTPAGARAADELGLNWLDLSGNAHLRDHNLRVWIQGHANTFTSKGRPASAFASKSSRVARALLIEPDRWWRQRQLSEHTHLDAGHVSRIVSRLNSDDLLERNGPELRARSADRLLDAWADEYRFDRHDVIVGHATGSGIELARSIAKTLNSAKIDHAFTGLAAAYLLDEFARFRLVSVYVDGDPRVAADEINLRRNERGANVQIIGPDDAGVFDGERGVRKLNCVAPVQVYLDLQHLPERAGEAAEHLRADGKIWCG